MVNKRFLYRCSAPVCDTPCEHMEVNEINDHDLVFLPCMYPASLIGYDPEWKYIGEVEYHER